MSKKIEIERTATTIRVPSDMLKKVKIRCVVEDIKVNDYVLGLIEKDMQRWEAKNPNVPS